MASMHYFPQQLDPGLAQAQCMSGMGGMGEFAASVAHEVRQPLAAIALNADAALRWLDHDPPRLDEARAALALVASAGSHASAVLRSVHGLACNVPGSHDHFVADDAVQELLPLLRAPLQRHAIHLETQLAPGRPLLQADPAQFRQVILNLLMNAIEALQGTSDRPRTVLLSSRVDGGVQHFSVADNGAGIAPQAAERLYHALYSSKPDGMGMGLAICRRILDAHGGRLWHAPGAPHGTVFHFTLPAR
ncbi:GHKL domain-containing protein [Janthinobacterium rivuli]|nr:GHKL domain-containing protein [Janthinobacterium sp. FT68W]